MIREKLEKEFTSMLVHTDLLMAYGNLASNYLKYDSQCQLIPMSDRKEKLKELRNSEPKEWITKIFTEGLDIPPLLYKANILWLKHLEETIWE